MASLASLKYAIRRRRMHAALSDTVPPVETEPEHFTHLDGIWLHGRISGWWCIYYVGPLETSQ